MRSRSQNPPVDAKRNGNIKLWDFGGWFGLERAFPASSGPRCLSSPTIPYFCGENLLLLSRLEKESAPEPVETPPEVAEEPTELPQENVTLKEMLKKVQGMEGPGEAGGLVSPLGIPLKGEDPRYFHMAA